jgi:hypothetical protein
MSEEEIKKAKIDELHLYLAWRVSFMREDLFYIKHGIDNDIPDQYEYRLRSLKGNLKEFKKDLEKLKNL